MADPESHAEAVSTGGRDFTIEESTEEQVIRVRSSSNPQAVASALSHAIYDSRKVRIRAIGAGAVNQSVKAMAIARGFVAPRGIDLSFKPGFDTTIVEGRDTSVITFVVMVA